MPLASCLLSALSTFRYNERSRWDEVSKSVRTIAGIAHAAKAPTEIRLLNNCDPVLIGCEGSTGEELELILAQLSVEPSGQTPICTQLTEVIKRLKSMEYELISSNKIALLVIMTDGESSDGSIVDILKPLEGIPLQIIIRISTEEKEITDYWQDVNSELSLDIYVLNGYEYESTRVNSKNNWLTYGEPLHQIREFGIAVSGINTLSFRQLSKEDIKSICRLLL